MAILKHTVECGPLGEVELTVSYHYIKERRQTLVEPGEPESASIRWIKFGGMSGIEVDLDDDYINAEIIPACVADWKEACDVAAEAHAEEMRERLNREAA